MSVCWKVVLVPRCPLLIRDATPDDVPALRDILASVAERLGAAIVDAPGYYLVQPTIGAFLSHLERIGEVRHEIERLRSVWSRGYPTLRSRSTRAAMSLPRRTL